MGRVARSARLAVAAALVVSTFSAVAVFRLSRLPTLTTVLARAASPPRARRLVLSSPSGILVVESEGAFRVTPEMALARVSWPTGLKVDEVLSVAQAGQAVALVYREGGARGLLIVEGDRARVVDGIKAAPGAELLAVHKGARGFDLYYGATTLLYGSLAPPYTAISDVVPLPPLGISASDEVEGMVFIGQPLALVRERSSYWLVGLDGKLHPMPPHAMTVWSASYTNAPIGFGAQVPFLDAHGTPHHLELGASYPALIAEADGTFQALALDRASDPPDAIESAAPSGRLALRAGPGALMSRAAASASWRTVASLPAPAAFAAFPVGERWIALAENGTQAVLLDHAGARLQPTSRAATIALVTGHSLPFYAVGLLLVLLFAGALPLLVLRTRRALRVLDQGPAELDTPDAEGLFTGTLKTQGGAVLTTDPAGRVHLSGECRLCAGGQAIELTAGMRRADPDRGVPLLSGDPIYVLGRLEPEKLGGPWRASGRKRIGPARGRYLIGRGTLADFPRHLAALESAQLTRVALVQLACAIALLLSLGLRPFA